MKGIKIISFIFVIFLISIPSFLSGETVDLEVAKRSAEYHGEQVFDKNLEVCDHELLYWPWGEPAVYVFTLMEEGDYYPEPILLDSNLIAGAYLVSEGKRVEGFRLMVQADRYMTIVVGATTDMPSYLKAHAGLPEHILSLAVMENPPQEPYWIYGGLFHILIGSRTDMGRPNSRVKEIHLGETVAVKELGQEKVDDIPAYVESYEWEPFLNPKGTDQALDNPYLVDVAKVKAGKHILAASEPAMAAHEGCGPASFVNCLSYLMKKGKVKYKGKSTRELLEWAAVCFYTDPKTKGTQAWYMMEGIVWMLKGMNYISTCDLVTLEKKPGLFLTKYADEINAKRPTPLVGGQGVFRRHAVAGIGYWKQGKKIQLVVHDGWEGTEPVYVKYSGYSKNKTTLPQGMHIIHPKSKKKYLEAKPRMVTPKKPVVWDKDTKRWEWQYQVKIKNKISALVYKLKYEFRDFKGYKYREEWIREKPSYVMLDTKQFSSRAKYKRGTLKVKFFLVDQNGHLLEKEKTLRLEDVIGTWATDYVFTYEDLSYPGSCTDTIHPDGRITSHDGSEGTWDLNGMTIKQYYEDLQRFVYTGTVSNNFNSITGTMTAREPDSKGRIWTGTWSSKRLSDGTTAARSTTQTRKGPSKTQKDGPGRSQ